jgi:hypothetical protein
LYSRRHNWYNAASAVDHTNSIEGDAMLQVLPTPSPGATDRDSDAADIVSSVLQNVEELMPISAAMRVKLARVREIFDGTDGKPEEG